MSAFQHALCHIYVADMASLFAYYRDVIGLEPESFSPEWSTFRIGPSVQLALHHGRQQPVGERVETGISLLVAPEIFAEVVQGLEARGAVIEGHIDEPGLKIVFVRDPEGNIASVATA